MAVGKTNIIIALDIKPQNGEESDKKSQYESQGCHRLKEGGYPGMPEDAKAEPERPVGLSGAIPLLFRTS
jgi:hypothetical protein